jgi:hypothetical protein
MGHFACPGTGGTAASAILQYALGLSTDELTTPAGGESTLCWHGFEHMCIKSLSNTLRLRRLCKHVF